MAFELDAGASVVIHTGHGVDTATDVYWGRGDSVWNDDTEQVVVVDADGRLVDDFLS